MTDKAQELYEAAKAVLPLLKASTEEYEMLKKADAMPPAEARAARAARRAGAGRVLALVAHGLFMEGSEAAVAHEAIDGVIVTDSVPPLRVKHGPMANKITTVSSEPLLAETIRRLHEDKPHFDLLVF